MSKRFIDEKDIVDMEELVVNEEDLSSEEVEGDLLSQATEVYGKEKTSKGHKIFLAVMSFLCALVILANVYMRCIMYFPKNRDFLTDNLYSDNSIVVPPEEFDNIINILESELGIEIPEEYEDEYGLLYAVRNNPNMSEQEKEFFYKYINLIKDNPYIDREEAYKSLLNVEILYKNRPWTYDKTVEGVYLHDKESIGIFEDDPDKSILGHEGIHCIFGNKKTEALPTYFDEGMTQLLYNEYFDDAPFVELRNYPFEIAAVKMLCELTSSDAVLKAYSCGDMGIICEDMAKTIGSYETAESALNMLNNAFLRYNELLEGKEPTVNDVNEIINGCIPTFRDCITKKYVEEGDPNRVSYFYNEILFVNIFSDSTSYEEYVADLKEFGSDHKAYFSSELKKRIASGNIVGKIEGSACQEGKVLIKHNLV